MLNPTGHTKVFSESHAARAVTRTQRFHVCLVNDHFQSILCPAHSSTVLRIRVFHSVALSLKDNQVTMMDESVNHCRSHLLVGEGPAPLGELKIRSKDEVFALITVTDDPE